MEAIVVNHPLIQDKLTIMRNKNTNSGIFRLLLNEISELLGYEATRNLPTYEEEIETPFNVKHKFPMVRSTDVAFVSILRAGTGMLDGVLKLVPTAKVGHIGLYRDPRTTVVVEYYFKMPSDLETKTIFVVDPLVATGHSAVAAVSRIKELNPKRIVFICLLTSPQGLAYFQNAHPDVQVYTAAIDEGLNEQNYIVPGMGDAGDRMFGTA